MKIGVPKELTKNENRVALTPTHVYTLQTSGHDVFIEKGAGTGSSFSDTEYEQAGATIVSAEEAWKQTMILKVKEPLEAEYVYFREGLIIFAYLHLASKPKLVDALVKNGVVAIAYETVQLQDNRLPLLTPMSEVAGYMATQIGASFLEKSKGGKGVLLSGIPGVKRGKVTVIGGGNVGENAARMAVGLGADVSILDVNPSRLRELDDQFGASVNTIMSSPITIENEIKDADLVIGAVLIPGSKAPTLVTEQMVKQMRIGSVIVDVAIDQGGIFETSGRVSTHDDPTYVKHDIIHYTVANMPGDVPRTSTIGLANETTPYILQLANDGWREACLNNEALRKGINVVNGKITVLGVAKAHELTYTDVNDVIQEKE